MELSGSEGAGRKKTPGRSGLGFLLRAYTLLLITSHLHLVDAAAKTIEIPCVEFSAAINIPCQCSLNEINATRINCDNVVFAGDFPVLPLRYYIQEFSQRNVGWQLLPTQIFTASDVPLKIVDFSHNSMRRLAERLFDGMEDTLEEIYISHNMLGDNLNPVFSTDEFKNLKFLRSLDLSYNRLSGISEDLIDGCEQLKVSLPLNYLLLLTLFVVYQAKASFCVARIIFAMLANSLMRAFYFSRFKIV